MKYTAVTHGHVKTATDLRPLPARVEACAASGRRTKPQLHERRPYFSPCDIDGPGT